MAALWVGIVLAGTQGRCCALMINVIYKGRALPLAWVVRQCPKGHAPEALHIELVELISKRIPEGTRVVFLGDGEFDGTDLQETMKDAGWLYACRTAKSTVATWEGIEFKLDFLGSHIKPGMLIELKEVQFTRDAYGPVMVLCCWAKDEAEPLYLVSNLSVAEEAIKYYQKRFRVETFFFRSKESRLQCSEIPFIRPSAFVSVIDRDMFGLSMDRLFRFTMQKGWMAKYYSPQESM